MGPSGCGKTSLLNFLAGKNLYSKLKCSGNLYINAKKVYDYSSFNNFTAYVQQDDVLMYSFTPRGKFFIIIFFFKNLFNVISSKILFLSILIFYIFNKKKIFLIFFFYY